MVLSCMVAGQAPIRLLQWLLREELSEVVGPKSCCTGL